MITLILFLVILSVLVAVHEFGHLIVAKWVGARVKEYAIGFPPRIFSRKWRGTEYSLNLTPLGGYVNIAGEEGIDEEGEKDIPISEKLSAKHPLKKIAVLVAGVLANVVLAWVLISITLMLGTYEPVDNANIPPEAKVIVLGVSSDSSAKNAGLKAGDAIQSVSTGNINKKIQTSEELISFLENNQDENVSLNISRGEENIKIENLEQKEGIVSGKKALGISISTAVLRQYSFFEAFYKGIGVTVETVKMIGVGISKALGNIVQGEGGLNEVAGPVGIGKIVGEARQLGVVSIITFAAFLSINLAIINILPFPALDGGRVVFTLIEWARGKPVSAKIGRIVHGTGFALLILLMIIITVHDVTNLVK